METYHKIQTIFQRDKKNNFKTLLEDEYSQPEFEYLKNCVWVGTEKIDGTNIRIKLLKEFKYPSFEGKTDKAQIPTFLYNKLNEIFTNENLKKLFPDDDICLYGEGYGAKIQKGGGNYIKDGVDFILFDIKISKWWLKREDIIDIATKLNIKYVPKIFVGTLKEAVDMTKKGFNSTFGLFQAEGLVLKPKIELQSKSGKRIITKIKYKDFIRSI